MKRPNGKYFLKIVKFPGTIFFSSALKYMYDLKINGYPEEQLEEVFNELVNELEETSVFIENEDKPEKILEFCKSQINKNIPRFCILALKKVAVKVVHEAVDLLKEDSILVEKKYDVKIFETGNKDLPRIEVIISKNIFQ